MFKLLEHPLTKSLDLDDPKTTVLRKRIIQEKPFLRKIYKEWYEWIPDESELKENKYWVSKEELSKKNNNYLKVYRFHLHRLGNLIRPTHHSH